MIELQGDSQMMLEDEELSCVREGSVVYRDGKPFKYEIHEFKVRANVQPFSGRDLLLVPEGDRHKEQLWAYVPNTYPEQGAVRVNDFVDRSGRYQIQSVEQWGSFTRARLMRIDVGPYRGTNEAN